MNDKYKFVSLILGIALVAALVRLVYGARVEEAQPAATELREQVYQNILSRKSVRSYTAEPVSREQLDTLLRAAMAAPTGKDMRPWKFVVVDDAEVIARLAEALPRAQMLQEAQAVIAVCGDQTVLDKEGRPSTNWTFDCSAATENLLLMAEAMDLGAVWVGVYPYEDRVPAVQEALGLPAYILPLNLIPIGHPKGDPQPKDKYNPGNIHFNGW